MVVDCKKEGPALSTFDVLDTINFVSVLIAIPKSKIKSRVLSALKPARDGEDWEGIIVHCFPNNFAQTFYGW